MNTLEYVLLGLALFFLILFIVRVFLDRRNRRRDREIQRQNEETLRQAKVDNQRLAEEYGEALSALMDYFSAYLTWTKTDKDNSEEGNAALEVAVSWDKLPKDTQKLLLPIAKPPGIIIKD